MSCHAVSVPPQSKMTASICVLTGANLAGTRAGRQPLFPSSVNGLLEATGAAAQLRYAVQTCFIRVTCPGVKDW